MEELRLELTSLVSGDGLRATETGYPAGQEGPCHGFSCNVREGDGFWPVREAVDRSTCSLLMKEGAPQGLCGCAENGLLAG
jgi:hypothetical protein